MFLLQNFITFFKTQREAFFIVVEFTQGLLQKVQISNVRPDMHPDLEKTRILDKYTEKILY